MSPETATPYRPVALVAPDDGSARVRSDRARAAGYAAGWAAGSRAAAEAAAEQQRRVAEQHERAEAERTRAVADAVAVLGRAAAAAAARTEPVVADVRRAVHEAALELAAAVLQRELTPGPASARAILGRALAVPAELGLHTVRLHPADLAQVRSLVLRGEAELPDGVTLLADAHLRPGDAVSEHAAGFLDAQVATALDRARRVLLEDLADDVAPSALPGAPLGGAQR